MPFVNLSNDPAQDYFADGITENLTTDLSRIPSSFVIARNTAFTFKGKTIDAKEIGRELGVRYVLEGSAQRDRNRVRVNAQLVDATSGGHLWADRFEDDVVDLYALQDVIVARFGNALGFELVKAESQKSARSKSPDAIDLTMRGWSTMWGSIAQSVEKKRESYDAAQALFEQALEIDAAEADALAGDAFATMAKYAYGWTGAGTDLDAKIVANADRALALAPGNVRAYHAKSGYLTMTGRADEALRAANSGLAINPNYAPLVAARALAETPLGRFEQAKSDAELAIRLSPRDPEIGMWRLFLGNAELGLRRFDAASVQYQKAIDAGFRSFQPYVAWRLPMRLTASRKRRSPRWRKGGASSRTLRSSGWSSTRRISRLCSRACAKRDCPKANRDACREYSPCGCCPRLPRRAAAPPFGGAEEGARLVDAFRLLGRGGGMVDDAGACQE